MYRPIPLDDALELFDPQTGHRIRLDAPARQGLRHGLRQRAPRAVQFALTNHCNLSCSFCSRPVDRRSAWTVASALELLADLDRLGVAEVAFGGGEPLVFHGLFELVDRLARETRLAVHLTTNGVLLSDDALARLRGKIGEIRLSLYDDNDWRATVARLVRHGQRFGVNLLVTPDRLGDLPALVCELHALGCRDVLLLPVIGHPSLALDRDQTGHLAALLLDPPWPALTIKLGVCWDEGLAHLPRLFPSSDCGAGREFLEITSDRQVRACSFHAASTPFATAVDVIAQWEAAGAALRAPAGCAGCPRLDGSAPAPVPFVERPLRVRVHSAFASNNSGSYTLLGSFATTARATEITALLTRLVADMQAGGEANPLMELLSAAGIPAPPDVGKTDDWPAEWSSPPEAVQVGGQVWWYAAYTVTMPEQLGHWFYAMGGRVQAELDHAHHPLLAQVSLWPDLPWNERRTTPLQPLIDALRVGPLAPPSGEAEGVEARVRESDWAGIEVLWRGPTPEAMRALVGAAQALGLRCRVSLSELPSDDVDLDLLW
ncbi:MAG: radical SAM protein [Myxococcota bacterium]